MLGFKALSSAWLGKIIMEVEEFPLSWMFSEHADLRKLRADHLLFPTGTIGQDLERGWGGDHAGVLCCRSACGMVPAGFHVISIRVIRDPPSCPSPVTLLIPNKYDDFNQQHLTQGHDWDECANLLEGRTF